MPESHRRQRWIPDRLLSWGESIGSTTRAVVAWHLHHRDRLKDEAPDESPVGHSNVRGAGYYH
ncbi:hypothetical protein ACR9GP_26130 [Enterobacter ludwigii]